MNIQLLWDTLFKKVAASHLVNKLFFLGILLSPGILFASISYETYIAQKYKDCARTTKKIFLTKEQKKAILEKNNLDDMSSLMLKYQIKCPGETISAYIDTHRVRTLNETVVIELKDQKVKHIEITNFMEPQEYQSPSTWLDQFKSKGPDFKMGKNIDGLTGATLSSHAITNAVQKIAITEKLIREE